MRMINMALWLSLASMWGVLAAANPALGATILWGVSDSGLEFGKGPIAGTNYAIPDPSYYLEHGIELIRVPFQIVRLQPATNGPLAPNMVSYLARIIAADQAAGAMTVLDPHGYGFIAMGGKSQDILAIPAAAAAYIDLMRRIALTFAHDNNVAIALMNEPHTGSDDDYAPIWNQAIAAIRGAGFYGVILVPHAHWSNASDLSPAKPFPHQNIIDPQHNWVLEVHNYLDPDDTGTYRKPIASPYIGADRLAGVIAWSRQTGIRIFLGETGTPPDAASLAAFQTMLNEIDAVPGVFWGVAIWGAGPWWKPNYLMRLDPLNSAEQPQFSMLESFVSPEIIFLAKDPGASDPKISIRLDGKEIAHAIAVSATRTGAPQAIALHQSLSPGVHSLVIQPIVPQNSSHLFVIGSTWKGAANSPGCFGEIKNTGYICHIHVP